MIRKAEDKATRQEERSHASPVWLDMDQAALDAAYDQENYAPNMQQILARYEAGSRDVCARLGAPDCYAYGPDPIEKLYLFSCGRAEAPVHIFFHGGGWRRRAAIDYAFAAELFVRAGAHYAVADFSPVQDTGGSLMPLAEQVRRAIRWVYGNAAVFGGDRSRIYISGFSSGAHLAAVALTTDWKGKFSMPQDIVKGGLCCGGMFDLEPVRLSARSSYIKFTDEMVRALSPQRHINNLTAPLIVACGTLETPEFQRQSRDFAAAANAAGKSVQILIGEGYNHFEMLETLANPYGLLGRAVLKQMRLGIDG